MYIYLIGYQRSLKGSEVKETKLEVIKKTDRTYYTEDNGLIKCRYLKENMDKIISNVKPSFPMIEYSVVTLDSSNNYAELFNEAAEICFSDMVKELEQKHVNLENRKKKLYGAG
jgi:hypothetical protein